MNQLRIEALQSFVCDEGIAIAGQRGCRNYAEPSGRDHSYTEEDIARVNEVDADRNLPRSLAASGQQGGCCVLSADLRRWVAKSGQGFRPLHTADAVAAL